MKAPSFTEFIKLIRQIAEIPLDRLVTRDTTVQALGIDSIQMMLIVSEIDTCYHVVLELDQLYGDKTMGDLHAMVVKNYTNGIV